MSPWINSLLLRHAPGSTLVFDANDGGGFLQLALTGREAGWRRVELGLPDADWSHDSFALAARTALQRPTLALASRRRIRPQPRRRAPASARGEPAAPPAPRDRPPRRPEEKTPRPVKASGSAFLLLRRSGRRVHGCSIWPFTFSFGLCLS
jgi:hypothetical protein